MTTSSSDELTGRVAVLTGATGRIGIATAEAFAEAGARVVLADLPGTPLEQLTAELVEAGHEATAFEVDVTQEESVADLVRFTMATYGRIDVLDNNAGATALAAGQDRDIVNMSTELWDQVYAINSRGPMLMCKHVLPVMVDQGSGSIINISSGTAQAGDLQFSAYASSKAALETLTRYVATQYGAAGVRCNVVAPGLVRVPDAQDDRLPDAFQDLIEANTLIGRIGVPRDISDAVLYLASDRSAYLTGHVLPVDGGFFAHLPIYAGLRELMHSQQGS